MSTECLPCAMTASSETHRWSGVLGMEGRMTGDGRYIERNALYWDDLPIPIRYVAADVGAHDGAQVVGRITNIWRGENGEIMGEGDFDLDSPHGQEAMRQVSEGLTNGVSMDLDDVSFEVRMSNELVKQMEADELAQDGDDTDEQGRVKVAAVKSDDEVRITTSGRIRAATIVAIPAFAEAKIALVAGATVMPVQTFGYNPTQALAPKGTAKGGQWIDTPGGIAAHVEEFTNSGEWNGRNNAADLNDQNFLGGGSSLIASAVKAPPRAWFRDPKLTGPTPLTVTDDGRVYGHLATWGTCHIGHSHDGTCITPPRSKTNYAHFRVGSVIVDDGTEIATGRITLETRHAKGTLNALQTLTHYEDTGMAVADVAAGEDRHGIWVAGCIRPGTPDDKIAALRGSPLSGDWRRVGSNLELVAALAVNVPGFPIPRPAGLVASGRMQSLVASGMVPPTRVVPPGAPDALSTDDLRWLKALAARERQNEASQMRMRVTRAELARKRASFTL